MATTNANNDDGDAAYASFLTRANQDLTPSDPPSTSQTKSKLDRTTTNPEHLPSPLQTLLAQKRHYTSDTDAPFEAVLLDYHPAEGEEQLPTASQLAGLLKIDEARVEVCSEEEFQEYGDVLDAVKEAGDGEGVGCFRVDRGGTRAEYYFVVGVTKGKKDGGKLVGVKARAVES